MVNVQEAHITKNPGRPYLDKVMTPIDKSVPSHIKDSNHVREIVLT